MASVQIPSAALAPSAEARAHSDALVERIRAAIDAGGGWIGFDTFMHMALYTPGLGYYSGGAVKFGVGGDFVTAPGLTPLFGRCVAQQIGEVIAHRPDADVIELGPGTGVLAADVLHELDALHALPGRYCMLDVSGELRARQQATLVQRVPHLLDRVEWLDVLPDAIDGVVVANEVLDALPVQLVHWTADGVFERGVACTGAAGPFRFEDRPIVDRRLEQAAASRGVVLDGGDYIGEIGLQAEALVASIGERLERGLLLLVDYGFGRREFFHPQRRHGTLMCHWRHHAHADPFHLPGLQDITAHVDFTGIAEAGVDVGLRLAGYTTQASFLVACGLLDRLMDMADTRLGYARATAPAQKLVSPAEMGELFKVMALTRGIDAPLVGFTLGDLTRTL
ncbi:MAG: SAM-dependent methyltransferase [Burkholderiales bacterium]|nr:SAM-dependent methyltransferase [Burkholderiales bacterium]